MEAPSFFKASGNVIVAASGQRFPVEHIGSYWVDGDRVEIETTTGEEPWSFKASIDDFEEAYKRAYEYSKTVTTLLP